MDTLGKQWWDFVTTRAPPGVALSFGAVADRLGVRRQYLHAIAHGGASLGAEKAARMLAMLAAQGWPAARIVVEGRTTRIEADEEAA